MSNDNPFSGAQFKTLKYRPDFPRQFDSIEAARAHCRRFFVWYSDAHRHGGLGLHTPTDVHCGYAGAMREQRAVILPAAYHARPERFVSKPPVPPKIPTNSWINPPEEMEAIAEYKQRTGASFRLTDSAGFVAWTAVFAVINCYSVLLNVWDASGGFGGRPPLAGQPLARFHDGRRRYHLGHGRRDPAAWRE